MLVSTGSGWPNPLSQPPTDCHRPRGISAGRPVRAAVARPADRRARPAGCRRRSTGSGCRRRRGTSARSAAAAAARSCRGSWMIDDAVVVCRRSCGCRWSGSIHMSWWSPPGTSATFGSIDRLAAVERHGPAPRSGSTPRSRRRARRPCGCSSAAAGAAGGPRSPASSSRRRRRIARGGRWRLRCPSTAPRRRSR